MTLRYPGLDVKNIAYTHASVVLVIFPYFMLQNEQSNSHALYSMTSAVVVLFAYPKKLNILTKELSYKNSTTEVIMLLYLIFLIQPSKRWTKFRFVKLVWKHRN